MSKHIKMMMLPLCPHCKKAFTLIDELCKEHQEYAQLKVEQIDEEKEEEKTRGYDYWYVPTFFVDDIKVHEGAISKVAMEEVLKAAL